MLIFKADSWFNDEFERGDRPLIWHLGEEVPNTPRVVTVQLDGDELNLLLEAMERTRSPLRSIIYTKRNSFHIPELTEDTDGDL